jgi:uncharacterized Rmd1/YagE family protein
VLIIRLKEQNIFIFDYGIIVLWAFDEEKEEEIINLYTSHAKILLNAFKKDKTSKIVQTYHYLKAENFSIARGRINIESNDLTEKLAISYALAQETTLKHYEDDVAETIEETKKIPIDMREKGEISLSKKEISRNIGLIFMQRSAINLNTDILDTPSIFWQGSDELETVYKTIRKFFNINKRIEILNKRLTLLEELYDVTNNEIKGQRMFRLEWIVVYLIVIEIFISLFWKMLVKDILKLY